MTTAKSHSLRSVYLALMVGVLALGYMLYRQLYLSANTAPFAQEMVLVFVGAVATIFLTAALLNRQTELELSKEARVLLFDQKNAVYMAAIEKVAEIVERRERKPSLIDELRVIGHKLAVVGSPEVVRSFQTVLDQLLEGLDDGTLSNTDAEEIMHAVAELTISMRRDMLNEVGTGREDSAKMLIRKNSRQMERLDDLDDLPTDANERSLR